MCTWGRRREGVMIQDRKSENILGNNILLSPDQSFLGFYRAAPCQRKRRTLQRYCLLGFSLSWGVYSLKEVLESHCASFRRRFPTRGAVTASATGRRCARWWGASTPGPSPSTELWATSPRESTGSESLSYHGQGVRPLPTAWWKIKRRKKIT